MYVSMYGNYFVFFACSFFFFFFTYYSYLYLALYFFFVFLCVWGRSCVGQTSPKRTFEHAALSWTPSSRPLARVATICRRGTFEHQIFFY